MTGHDREPASRRQTGGAVFRTPLGWAGVAVSDRGILRVVLPRGSRSSVLRALGIAGAANRAQPARATDRILTNAMRQLVAYFTGKTVRFDLPLDLGGATPFRRAVWRTAQAIPRGETRSYGWIAARISRPAAARAVGQAMAANPVPVIIP